MVHGMLCMFYENYEDYCYDHYHYCFYFIYRTRISFLHMFQCFKKQINRVDDEQVRQLVEERV
jgi:hypothetical protein